MHIPTRMCVVCKKRLDKNSLVRISCLDGEPKIDQNKVLSHRAIYVCYDEKCLAILQKSKAIERLLKVEINENFYKNLKKFVNLEEK